MEYKVGDTVLFKGNGIYSYAIMAHNLIKFRQLGFTHAGIISSVKGDKIYIHEAFSKWDAKDYKAYEYSRNDLESKIKDGKVLVRRPYIELTGYEEACKSYEGAYYDWLSVFLMLFKVSINSTKAIFCSEVNGRIYYDVSNKTINIASEFGISYEKLTPQHLYMTTQLYTVVPKSL